VTGAAAGPGADASGRRALFSVTGEERPDTRRRAPARGEGRQALFSAAPPDDGTVVVGCSSCEERTPVPALALWRHLVPSVWVPMRSAHPVWMHCPSCGRRTWCALDWRPVTRALRRR
jgi:hypothetical protein